MSNVWFQWRISREKHAVFPRHYYYRGLKLSNFAGCCNVDPFCSCDNYYTSVHPGRDIPPLFFICFACLSLELRFFGQRGFSFEDSEANVLSLYRCTMYEYVPFASMNAHHLISLLHCLFRFHFELQYCGKQRGGRDRKQLSVMTTLQWHSRQMQQLWFGLYCLLSSYAIVSKKCF